MSVADTSGTTKPQVITSYSDYAPGDTADITATGFETGATVEFQVQHVSGAGADGILGTLDDELEENDGAGHDVWSVTDGGADDLDGLLNGVIQTTWYVNPDDSLDATFLLSAIGSDGQLATYSFTDAAGTINKVYQHWADGDSQPADWNNNILSDGKSNYFEGEVVPHVFVYKASSQTPLVNGQTYSFTITYNNYQLNSNAGGFDFITTYDLSRTPDYFEATTVVTNPVEDGTFFNAGGMHDDGVFYTVDADITSVSDALLAGGGNEDRQVTVDFIYTGTNTSNGFAEIFFGLAIAQPGDVKATSNGASAWTGGSLQTTVDIGGSGATSIQLAPGAIIKGTISGFKFEDVNGNGVWDISSGEQGLSGWTIFIDKDGDNVLDAGEESTTTTANGSYSFSVVPDSNLATEAIDPYVIREVNQSGWVQTTISPAAIVISAAEPSEVNVNFGNQEIIASLTIAKVAEMADGGTAANAAGDVISYTITVTNTGNIDLTNVMLSDDYADDAPVLDSGDTDADEVLDVGEKWLYTAQHKVTQDELNSNGTDGSLVNTATVTTAQTDPEKASASVPVDQNKALTIDKITIIGTLIGDGLTNVAVGAPVTWQYTVTNTGNVSLKAVSVVDDAGTSLNLTDDFPAVYYSGDTNDDDVMSPGEEWIFNASGTTVAGSYSNIATVTAFVGDSSSSVTSFDDSSYTSIPKDYGLIAPTATTVNQYISGTASTFEDYYASQGGVVQYGVKGSQISQTNPGVFFYFTGLSNGLKASDADNNGSVDKMTILVDQSDPNASVGAFMPTFSDVKLYKITDLDANGIDAGDTITTVNLTKSQVTISSGGDVTVNFTPDKDGSLYVVGIKYSTGSVIGSSVGNAAANWPTVDYTFQTSVGGKILFDEEGGITLAPKVKPLMLDGEAGDGAKAVNDAQIDHVINQAVQYWAAHGANADDINMLKATDVAISDLGGEWLSMTDGTSITIDDDAVGHGWSLGLGNVAPQKVDLFSALVHEMGHLLGYEHDVLGEDLAVGERVMPLSSDDGHGVPDFIGSVPPAALVGVPQEQQFHFA